MSLNITLFQNGEDPVSTFCNYGRRKPGCVFKINTLGEEAFLDKKLIELLDV